VDRPAADYEIRDPFVLEFLNLKDEYSESDLENSLITELERFLLELGNDFTFVARQRRLRVGTEWYRVDLLLFHRRLRCLVVIAYSERCRSAFRGDGDRDSKLMPITIPR